MGFIIRGFIWDIPILIFAYVLFCGPIRLSPKLPWSRVGPRLHLRGTPQGGGGVAEFWGFHKSRIWVVRKNI